MFDPKARAEEYAKRVADSHQTRTQTIEPRFDGMKIPNPLWQLIHDVAFNAYRTGARSGYSSGIYAALSVARHEYNTFNSEASSDYRNGQSDKARDIHTGIRALKLPEQGEG